MTYVSFHSQPSQTSWTHYIKHLADSIDHVVTRVKARNKLRAELSRLSQKDLRDAGLTLHDVSIVDTLPTTESCARELRRIASTRRQNW